MLRDWDMDKVSDGKLYTSRDMAKLGCQDCAGCSECCRVVGDSIILDPYDIYHMTGYLKKSFEELLAECIELHVVDGIILPNLKIEADGRGCTFLDADGRCRIHSVRPGICRLFPLGRIFQEESFSYFLQVNECRKTNRTKVRIGRWLGIKELGQYENFVNTWHWHIKKLSEEALSTEEPERTRQISMELLNKFYIMPYNSGTDFYVQFEERMENFCL